MIHDDFQRIGYMISFWVALRLTVKARKTSYFYAWSYGLIIRTINGVQITDLELVFDGNFRYLDGPWKQVKWFIARL